MTIFKKLTLSMICQWFVNKAKRPNTLIYSDVKFVNAKIRKHATSKFIFLRSAKQKHLDFCEPFSHKKCVRTIVILHAHIIIYVAYQNGRCWTSWLNRLCCSCSFGGESPGDSSCCSSGSLSSENSGAMYVSRSMSAAALSIS